MGQTTWGVVFELSACACCGRPKRTATSADRSDPSDVTSESAGRDEVRIRGTARRRVVRSGIAAVDWTHVQSEARHRVGRVR